jgi:hypothetical protein
VYEFQIAAFNLTGEARLATTDRQVAGRKLPGNPVIHPNNNSNGSNGVAASWAWVHNQSCQNDTFQIVCFGSPPNLNGAPITVGDYMFYKDGPLDLEHRLVCEAWINWDIRMNDSPSAAYSLGPNILLHESIHSRQWAALWMYPDWLLFALAYGAAAEESMKKYFNPWQGNAFEQNAGLYWGSYVVHPRYWIAKSLYC